MEGTLKILKYGYPERPKWRQHFVGPTISEMLKDILSYSKRFNILKDQAKGHPQKLDDLRSKIKTTKRHLLLKYLLNVQQEEDIGVKDERKTREIIDALDTVSLADENSPPLLESFPSLEDEISYLKAEEEGMKKSIAETKNLYKAYKKIVSEIKNIKEGNAQELKTYFGLLETKMFVEELHKVLMDGIMGENSTLPGHYSTERRLTRDHEYSKFETESIAEQTVQYLIDRYNSMLYEIKKAKISDEERLKMSFKCASSFLFTFLQLHPFADGNGRLARLLASYSMLTFSPFMTPIYNVFSKSSEKDYIDALVEAERNSEPYPLIEDKNSGFILVNDLHEKNPGDLCAMLIESNWTMWRQFLIRLEDEAVVLFEWESPRQSIGEPIDQNPANITHTNSNNLASTIPQDETSVQSNIPNINPDANTLLCGRVTRSMTRSEHMSIPLPGVRMDTRSMVTRSKKRSQSASPRRVKSSKSRLKTDKKV